MSSGNRFALLARELEPAAKLLPSALADTVGVTAPRDPHDSDSDGDDLGGGSGGGMFGSGGSKGGRKGKATLWGKSSGQTTSDELSFVMSEIRHEAVSSMKTAKKEDVWDFSGLSGEAATTKEAIAKARKEAEDDALASQLAKVHEDDDLEAQRLRMNLATRKANLRKAKARRRGKEVADKGASRAERVANRRKARRAAKTYC